MQLQELWIDSAVISSLYCVMQACKIDDAVFFAWPTNGQADSKSCVIIKNYTSAQFEKDAEYHDMSVYEKRSYPHPSEWCTNHSVIYAQKML